MSAVWISNRPEGTASRALVRADAVGYLSCSNEKLVVSTVDGTETVTLVRAPRGGNLPDGFHLALLSAVAEAEANLAGRGSLPQVVAPQITAEGEIVWTAKGLADLLNGED